MDVHLLDAAPRRPLISLAFFLAWALLKPCAAAAAFEDEGGVYPEMADGESILWAEPAGVGAWITRRSPVGDFAPLVLGLGYGHRIGVARLAWRVHLFADAPGEGAPLRFVYADLLSIERVLATATWRPYWRIAVGFALDLVGAERALGSSGYFNDTNGAAAGLGLAHGWGVDAFFSAAWFVRLEATARVHGGAGRVGVLGSAHLGVGHAF